MKIKKEELQKIIREHLLKEENSIIQEQSESDEYITKFNISNIEIDYKMEDISGGIDFIDKGTVNIHWNISTNNRKQGLEIYPYVTKIEGILSVGRFNQEGDTDWFDEDIEITENIETIVDSKNNTIFHIVPQNIEINYEKKSAIVNF